MANILWRAVCVYAICASSYAASYYVDATLGSDEAAGSDVAPWKTLAYVTNQVLSAGDTIYLKRGETWTEPFVFKWHRVTLDAYGSGALPIIDGENTIRTIVNCGDSTNTVTRNINIKNGSSTQTGALWSSSYGTNTIESCTLQNHGFDAGAAAGGDSHIIVSNCWIEACADEAVTLHSTSSGLVQSCVLTNNADGINNSGTTMEIVVNDTVFIGNDIDFRPGSTTATLNRCTFTATTDKFHSDDVGASTTYNYCIFNAAAAFQCVDTITLNNCVLTGDGSISVGSASTVAATNSVFYNWNDAAYLFAGGAWTAQNCIAYDVTTWRNHTAEDGTITSDPLFVSASNFQLQSESPAINAGVSVGLTSDFRQYALVGVPDIGAYEYGAGPAGALRRMTATTLNAGTVRGP